MGVITKNILKFKNAAVCLQSADPKKQLVVGITESAGNNLEWFIDNFYKKEKESFGFEEVYKLIDKESALIPAGSDHLIFTPWLLGERCPVSNITTRGTVFNLGLEHTRGHFVRAMGEGIAYNVRWIIENLEKDFGFSLKSLRITGGGSNNNLWMQCFADITKRKIETTNHPKMSGALGSAMCAFVGLGRFESFDEVNNFVKVDKTYIPNSKNEQIYNELFRRYKDLYGSLRRTYEKANLKRFNI